MTIRHTITHNLVRFSLTLLPAGVAQAESKPSNKLDFGARIDCTHDTNRNEGSTQPCLAITGLRLGYQQNLGDKVTGHLRLDPFGTPVAAYRQTPLRDYPGFPTRTAAGLSIVDHYAVIWQPRPNLEIAIESFAGAAEIPNLSGLTMAGVLADTGWEQTAMTATYHLKALSGLKVKLGLGNGEGENFENLDPQQYFSFRIDATILEGLLISAGMSFDGNHAGSQAQRFYHPTVTEQTGFSTQRLAVSAQLDGKFASARGLKLVIGMQRSTFSDLNKDLQSVPTLDQWNEIDPSTFLIEDPLQNKANVLNRDVIATNMSYRILDTYFIGFDLAVRSLQTGEVHAFQACSSIDPTSGACVPEGDPSKKISQTSFSFGGGFDLTDTVLVTLEFHRTWYDKLYAKSNYTGRDGKRTDTSEAFNARIAYHWD